MLRKLSFTARIFLASALLVVAALAVAAVTTYTRGYQVASTAANDNLEHSRAVQQNFQSLRFQQLKLMSRLLSTDPAFVSYVVEAGGNGLSGARKVDVRSIADLLSERQVETGFDFGMVLDAGGSLLARSGNGVPASESLAADPVVAAAMQSQSVVTGYWRREGQVYQVAVAPLANRDELAGYLVLALALDQALLQNVKQVSGAELVVLDSSSGKYQPVSATLEPNKLAALVQSLDATQIQTEQVFSLDVGGEHWLAYAEPLGTGGRAGTALTLTSFDQAMGGFRAILTEQILAALVATLLAVGLSWWLSLRLGRPLKQLAQAAQSAARGDFQRRFKAEGEGEIAQLTQAFDSLLSDLREKNEIENYMADLAKYQPDAAADHSMSSSLLTPESLSGAVVAVHLHSSVDANMAMPDKALLEFNQVLRNLEIPAKLQGGRLLATTGSRAFLVFDGVDKALIAGAAILDEAFAQGQLLSAAGAVGMVITGPAEWTTGTAASVLGQPVRQLDELLPDAAAGTFLATAEFAKLAEAIPGVTRNSLTGSVSHHTVIELVLPATRPTATDPGHTLAATLPVPGDGVLSMRPKLAPGLVLGGRYEILSELGSGGMAVVYKARDRQLNEVVALKTLKSQSANSGALLDAMKSEIRLARKITHRNVLRTYDFGEIAGVPFISMEYVRGMTLKYLLQKREHLPFAAGLRILRQVCTALQVAHEQGVLHRDIKPENVMLEPSGNAKLMDFGIASPIKRDEAQDQYIVGTPRYASPEQLAGQAVDERTDVYACGVMMYQMFTGRMPFTDFQVDKLLQAKNKEEYRPLTELKPDFPESIGALIVACLKRDPEARPKNAVVLLAALENIRV